MPVEGLGEAKSNYESNDKEQRVGPRSGAVHRLGLGLGRASTGPAGAATGKTEGTVAGLHARHDSQPGPRAGTAVGRQRGRGAGLDHGLSVAGSPGAAGGEGARCPAEMGATTTALGGKNPVMK